MNLFLPNSLNTVQAGVNGKSYFAISYTGTVNYYTETLPEQTCTVQAFAAEL